MLATYTGRETPAHTVKACLRLARGDIAMVRRSIRTAMDVALCRNDWSAYNDGIDQLAELYKIECEGER